MAPYIFLRLVVSTIRAFFSVVHFVQRHYAKNKPDWQNALGCWTKEYTIRSSIGSPDIRIRVWSPPGPKAATTPVHINFHGSGYILPQMYGNDSDFCQRLALELGITVLDCDYAKAPEYPFPHAYTDGLDVLRHVIFECGHLYDISRLTIGGFSAGGGLAFALCQNEELGRKYIKGIVGFYPYLDVLNIPGVAPKGPPGTTAPTLQPMHFKLFKACYARPPYLPSDPRISPALVPTDELAAAMKDKNVCIITGGLDNLQPSASTYVERLRGVGTDVSYENMKICPHSWDKEDVPGSWDSKQKEQAYNFVIKFLKSVY